MKKAIKGIFLVLVLGFVILFAIQYSEIQKYIPALFGKDASPEFEAVVVDQVVDGDTIWILNAEGEREKIRFIGVNTPESVHSDASKNTPEGKAASKYLSSILEQGMTVYLEYDEERIDQYGRTLAYVWLSPQVNTTNFEDFKTYNVGALLLQNTYCEAKFYSPNGKYKKWYEMLDIENP